MAGKTNVPNPYSCRDCDTDRWHHGWSYTPSAGLHQWIRPTDRQILTRMVVRRMSRLKGGA